MHGLEPKQGNILRCFYKIYKLDKQQEGNCIFNLFLVTQVLEKGNSHRFKMSEINQDFYMVFLFLNWSFNGAYVFPPLSLNSSFSVVVFNPDSTLISPGEHLKDTGVQAPPRVLI